MRRWVPEAFDVMARATLRPDPTRGDWTLACPREFEAHVFRSNRDTSTWSGLGQGISDYLIGLDFVWCKFWTKVKNACFAYVDLSGVK